MRRLTAFLALACWVLASTSHGATFKLGTLFPDGTTWATSLKQMAKEIKKATDGRVKLKLYLGGAAGDEPDLQRKIKIGQFHGGIFTGKTLGEIHGDFRLMEVPFNFIHDRKKAVQVLGDMEGFFQKGFRTKGFEAISLYELGKVFMVSKKNANSIEKMRGTKIWAWEGDALVGVIMDNLQMAPVPLALPDVMTSLSTGIIDSAYATPTAINVLQWPDKVSYLFDFPITYSFGGLLLSQKAWKKMSAADQEVFRSISQRWAQKINDATIQENNESLQAFKKMGIEFVQFPKSDIERGAKIRSQIICDLKGKLFTQTGINAFAKAMQAQISCPKSS